MCPLVLLYTLTLSYALKFPSVPKGVVQVLKVKTWCLILSSPYDTHIMLFVSCPHVIVSHRRCTPRRMNQSPTQWQPHPAAQEASPTRPPPPSPPPPSPPSTRATSQTYNTPLSLPCSLFADLRPHFTASLTFYGDNVHTFFFFPSHSLPLPQVHRTTGGREISNETL